MAAVVVATAVLAGAFVLDGGTPSPRLRSVDRAAPRLVAYEVVYEVTELERRREETIIVRPPYESLRTSDRDGVRTATLVNREGLWQLSPPPSSAWRLLDAGRRRAEGDVRVLGGLRLLEEIGLAERLLDRRVLGRSCAAYRVAEPIGNIATKPPTDDEHVELCVDETGVMLDERWVLNGEVIREQRAIKLDTSPRLASDVFDAEPAAEPTEAVAPTRRELPLTDEIRGGLAVSFDLPTSIDDDGGTAMLDLDPIGQPIGGTVHRFLRRGTDVVDVEEVESASVDRSRGIRHNVLLGEGFVETDVRTVTLRIALHNGVAVVLRGPNLDLLDEVASGMRLADEDSEPDDVHG